MTFVPALYIFLASYYSLNKNAPSVGEEKSSRKFSIMCSPFSAAFWRKSLSSYQNLDRTSKRSQLGSIYEETDDHVLSEKESESFRNFASPKQILSHTWRERIAEKLPLWQDRQPLAPKSSARCPPCSCIKSGLGLFLATASGILFAIASLFVKLSNTTIPAFEIVFFRLIIQTLLVLPAAIWAQADLLGEKKHRPYLVCFGAVNFASISCIYGSFTKLPLGDATVCISTTPIFTALVAYVFLKESWHIFDAVATFICLGGVVLITRPTFIFGTSAELPSHVTETSHLIGYGVALSGAVVQSLTFVMVRRVGGSVSFYTNVFYFGWCSALLSGFTMFIFEKPVIPDCGTTRWFLIGVALCGVFGSFCLNRGLQLEKAAPAALMRNVDILLAFLFDYAFFGQQPHLLTLLGGVLVVLSTGGVALAKWWRSRDTL